MNKAIATCAVVFVTALPVFAIAKYPQPERRVEKYSVTKNQPVQLQARRAKLPLMVYGEGGKTSLYVPSGFMGDSEALKMSTTYESAPTASGEVGKTSLKIVYQPKGSAGWAGIYWLTPANNWGTVKGAGFDLSQAKRLTFWVRGDKGGEVIAEIKVGGMSAGQYPDSDEASLGPLKLSTAWEQYSIDLTNKDLRHIVGGFAFTMRRIDNVRGAKFYLDEISFDDGSAPTPETSAMAVPSVDTSTTPLRKVIALENVGVEVSSDVKKELEEVLTEMAINKNSKVVVEGHTDTVGPVDENMKRSQEQAGLIADYLRSQGVSADRIAVVGYGGERPLSQGEAQRNSRVEVLVYPQ